MNIVTSLSDVIVSDTIDDGVRESTRLLSDGRSDSYLFRVHNEAAVLTAYNLTSGEVALNAVLETNPPVVVPLSVAGVPVKLTPTNNRVIVVEEGLYQLTTTTANEEAIIALTMTKNYMPTLMVSAQGQSVTPEPTAVLPKLTFRKINLDALFTATQTLVPFTEVKTDMDVSYGEFSTDVGYEGTRFYPKGGTRKYKVTVHMEGHATIAPFASNTPTTPPTFQVDVRNGSTVAMDGTVSMRATPPKQAVGETVPYYRAELYFHIEDIITLTEGADSIVFSTLSNTTALGYTFEFSPRNCYVQIEVLDV